MTTRKLVTSIGIAATLGLSLGACGSAATSHSSGGNSKPVAARPSAVATTAPNPVTVLKETGAYIRPGTVSGEYDLSGNRYASGAFSANGGPVICTPTNCAGSEDVTVRIFASPAAMAA